MERGAKSAKAKVAERPTVARKPRKAPAGLEVEQRLAEALEQHAAISEILRVISQSPTDVQPVFDTIAAAALTLCHASAANVFTFDGKLIWLASLVSAYPSPDYAETFRKRWPMPPGRGTAATRAILTRSIVEIPGVLKDADYAVTTELLAGGFHSVLSVPLIRDGAPIGAISVGRLEAGSFPAEQIKLLKTFADQAVIAIENVRLFNETREALEQQTATAEILKVISSSPADVQPVFEAIAQRAASLSDAKFSYVTTFDGEWIHLRATHGPGTEEHYAFYPIRPGSGAVSARVTRDRAPVQIPDVLADADYAQKEAARMQGCRSAVGDPMF